MRKVKGYVSTLTFANLVYIMRKEFDPKKIEETLEALSLLFEFADFNVSDLTRAAELGWDDFEDAVQSVTAERVCADLKRIVPVMPSAVISVCGNS